MSEESYELDNPAPGKAPKPPSLLDADGEVPCPGCGKPMATGVLVCMHCGYDMNAGKKQATNVGAPVEKPPEPEKPKALSGEKGLQRNSLLIIGSMLLITAIFMGGWSLKPETDLWLRFVRCFVVLLQVLTHVGTGLVALWCASQLLAKPFGRIDLAALRFFVAVAAFLLILNTPIPVPLVGPMLKFVLAIAVYWGVVLILFTKEVFDTNAIAALHAAVAMVLYIQSYLWSMVSPQIQW